MEPNNNNLSKSATDNPIGRPRTIGKENVQKLMDYLMEGHTVLVACRLSGIARSTYYAELERNEAFRDKVTAAQDFMTSIASAAVTKSLMKGNLDTAKWWLERQDKLVFHAQRMKEYRVMQKVIITEPITIN